jgi:hypothetical protein
VRPKKTLLATLQLRNSVDANGHLPALVCFTKFSSNLGTVAGLRSKSDGLCWKPNGWGDIPIEIPFTQLNLITLAGLNRSMNDGVNLLSFDLRFLN